MTVAPGTRFGPYEILSPLGAGGMGEVYRARDTRLGRDVAVKVLPRDLAGSPEARARLEREARAISQLQHPNLCALYDVGREGDAEYLVMELLEGETVAQRLERGPLSVEETLTCGAEVADALAHAHEHGVVHRDLKASNVILTRDGRAKVLDFGLATTGAGQETLAETVTEGGGISGTPHYLSPELLRGARADARSDLWALGALLFEMVSGTKPFQGRTAAELSGSILHDPPAALPARVPPGLKSLILRCLAKEPARRDRTAGEVRAALVALHGGAPGSTSPAPARGIPWSRWAKRGALALVAALLLARFVWLATRPREPFRELKQRQLAAAPMNPSAPPFAAISPDGKTLALLEGRALSLRSVDTGESHTLTLPDDFVSGGIVVFGVLSWAPDGSRLLVSGVTADRTPCAWSVPVLGGRARKILSGGSLAAFAPDGRHIAYVRQIAGPSQIWCAGPDGEEPRLLAASDTSGAITCWPTWAPGGRRVVYSRMVPRAQGYQGTLETCDLNGRRRRVFTDSPVQGMHSYSVSSWLPDGRIVFALGEAPPSQGDMNLWALRVDPRSGEPSGAPRRITQWQQLSFLVPTASGDGKRLCVNAVGYQSDVYVGETGGGATMLRGIRRLTQDDRFDVAPTWTPDGKAILFTSDRNGTFDVFRQGLDATEAEPLVSGSGDQIRPQMSPDGTWILYQDVQTGAPGSAPVARIMRLPAGGGAAEKVMDVQPAATFRCARAPSTLCVVRDLEGTQAVFTAFDPVRGRGRELARATFRTDDPPVWDLAPDGSALAILTQPDSLARIDLISIRGGARETVTVRRPIGLTSLAWTPDGKGWIGVGVNLDDGWRLVHVARDGAVTLLTPQQFWMYSAEASPDGRRIAFTNNLGQGSFWLLENF